MTLGPYTHNIHNIQLNSRRFERLELLSVEIILNHTYWGMKTELNFMFFDESNCRHQRCLKKLLLLFFIMVLYEIFIFSHPQVKNILCSVYIFTSDISWYLISVIRSFYFRNQFITLILVHLWRGWAALMYLPTASAQQCSYSVCNDKEK